ncbi:MAG TPA: OmpA family protein [Terracidiphilus sp.]|jgi:chemotaxis protein MotB
MRRKRYVEESASHDRWLISYADFITLLFAFFVVLFASAYRDKHAIIRVSHAIHNGFETLGVFAGGSDKAAIAYAGLPVNSPDAPPGRETSPGNSAAQGIPTADLLELRRQLEAAMGAELKSHEIEISVTPEGFVVSLKELGFFDSGQAELLPGAAEKIKRIAKILMQHDLELRVEGHSDNQPIHNQQFRSNWELSTARAMAVLLPLVDNAGYDPRKISVAGYGQYRPVASDATPEGRRMNRRVDLVVLGAAPLKAAVHP